MDRIRTSFAVVIVFLLVASSSALAVRAEDQSQEQKAITVENASDFSSENSIEESSNEINAEHDPIRINNNSDFADKAEKNNWPGNGSEGNPYIIENYQINADGYGYGIYIGNVTDHFVVQDCSLQNSSGKEKEYFRNSGIYLYNTKNGSLEENTATNNSVGITLTDSADNLVLRNEIKENFNGTELISSTDNILASNNISRNNRYGISLSNTSSENRIESSDLFQNQESGLILNGSHQNSMIDNEFVSNNLSGIVLLSSDDNEIKTSTFKDNQRGVRIISSVDNLLEGNTISKNKDSGLSIESSDNNIIDDNNVSLNEGNGIYLNSSNYNIINYTSMYENMDHGIFLNDSDYNHIYHNNFIKNVKQAFDSSSNNTWNGSYPTGGNYWNNYSGADKFSGPGQSQPGGDGVIDNPYTGIDGGMGTQDDYPLVDPVPTPYVRIENPTDGTTLSTSNVSVNWTGMYRFSDTLMYEVRIDQKPWIDVKEDMRYNFTKLAIGNHTVEVKVKDMMGNTESNSVSFELYYEVDEIDIFSKSSILTAGESQIYNATGYNSTGEEIGLVPVDWSIDGGAGGFWIDDVYFSEVAGSWTITGSYKGIENYTTLLVEPGPADSFQFDPIDNQTVGKAFNITIQALDKQENVAKDYNSDAQLIEDTGTIEPNSTGPFTQGTWTGEVTITEDQENITIIAERGEISGESERFNVKPAVVEHVDIHPKGIQNLAAGKELNFTAEAYDGFGNQITDDDDLFNWENATDWGFFKETEVGKYNVSAEYNGLRSNVTEVNVKPAEVDTVSIEPSEPVSIEAGEEIDFSAEAHDEYGNLITEDEEDFMWTAEGGFIQDGNFYETTAGEYDVRAIYFEEKEVRSPFTTVTVEPSEVEYSTIDPSEEQTVTAGDELDFSAAAYDRYDNLITEDDQDFQWENTDSSGLFYEEEVGGYNVTASYNGIGTEIVAVEVEPAEVEYVSISPDEDQTVKAGEDLDFSAAAYDSYDNLITEEDGAFRWRNAGNSGLFYEEEVGGYNVTASYGGVETESVSVRVEPAEVYSVELDPDKDKQITSIEVIDFSAAAYDEYDNLISDEDLDFNWQNASNTGLFNQTFKGEYQVNATFGNVSSPAVTVKVELKVFHITVGPLLDINGDLVTDAVVTLSWDGRTRSLEGDPEALYEADIGLRKRPQNIRFNITIEHEGLDEGVSNSFSGSESGEVKVEEIGESPDEPAGIGPAVIVILILFVIVIIMAIRMSLQKAKETRTIEDLEKREKEMEEEFEDIESGSREEAEG
ncbi:MAG: right-handed parallel beta-helix repeat-containing protein [Candidatus Thermoplasmatota archaeon]|nr:right-handed parallel beta-helix repeat-containing protein [Candidatus Thermoplasmatota archaeon]